MILLTVNGAVHELDADPQMPLLWALRDRLELTGSKYGCDNGECGACTVLVDGQTVRSCTVTLEAVDGSTIETIENVAETEWQALQEAWTTLQVPQCGFCSSGMMMAAIGLLRSNPHPSREEIRTNLTNLCRCASYPRIEEAILLAATRVVETRRRAALESRAREVVKKRLRRRKKP